MMQFHSNPQQGVFQMLQIVRVLSLPAQLAANTIYLTEDGTAEGLMVVVTGSTGAVSKRTRTPSQIQAMIEAAEAASSGALATEAAAIRSELAAGDAATLTSAQTYTDAREAAIRSELAAGDAATLTSAQTYTDAREASVRSDMASADTAALDAGKAYTDSREAAGLQSAKDYTDARDVAVRADLVAEAVATLASAQTYTDTRETDIRADMAAGDAATLSAAQAAAEDRLQAEKTAILNTTDTKIATAIGSLDMSSQAHFAADIAARDALVPSLIKSSFVLVADATGDATVGAGAALYFFNLGDASFSKIAEYESMNFMDVSMRLLAKLGEQDGLLTFNGQLVATVQHVGSEW